MIIKSTIKKKWESGRWNFLINAALRAPAGTAVVVEGLTKNERRSGGESIRHRKDADLVVIERFGLLVVYKPSERYWEEVDA